MPRKIPFLILGLTGPLGAGCSTLAYNISRVSVRKWIDRQKLIEKNNQELTRVNSLMIDPHTNTQALEDYNRQMIDGFNERTYLQVLSELEDTHFKIISMSTLILKLAIESVSTEAFYIWKDNHSEVGNLLEEFHTQWIDSIKSFNENYNNSINIDKKPIDKMFKALKEFREVIGKAERLALFSVNGQMNKFYLQEFGENLRRTGNAFDATSITLKAENLEIVANEANKLIKYIRNRGDEDENSCFVIDAFRNPSEVEFFRTRYGQFYLISIYASYEVRTDRILADLEKIEGLTLDIDNFAYHLKTIGDQDWGEEQSVSELYSQNVSRCCYLADIAISNDKNLYQFDIGLFNKFLKYYALIVSPGCIHPTKEEMYMNLAYSLSLRSTCICRQVGAVITDADGYVLGEGWNDVGHGQIGCGLRQKSDFTGDTSLFSIDILKSMFDVDDLAFVEDDRHSFCFKDIFSKKKIREKLDATGLSQEQKGEVLNKLKLKRLEFCRSLHAEENALLQVASKGGNGVRGGVIYTTTFPCELCAKKIYQSGIKKIYYTEPYPGSISESVFLKDGIKKIELKQFEGVKSFGYFRLYKPHYDKKEAQKLTIN